MNGDKSWVRTPRGIRIEPYPLLSSTRTASGGWRLCNPYVVMLEGATDQSGCERHYGKDARRDFYEEHPAMPPGFF
jgi:hypothetical protein